MHKSSQGKPMSDKSAVPSSTDPADASRVEAASTSAARSTDQTSISPAPGGQDKDKEKGLSRTQHVVELADGLSLVADQLHERIMHEIRGYDGRSVPDKVKEGMRKLLDDEMLLRQRANSLYADAAAFVIQGLDQPQSKLVALTADAAHKIRRIGVIAEVTGLVGGLLLLAGAVASGKPSPVVLAIEKIRLHAKALDALGPPPSAS